MAFDPKKREAAIQEIASELAGENQTDDDVNDSPENESIDSESPETEQASEKEEEGEIKTLTDLAQAIGLEPSQLYDLELKLAETGESVKLGSLKDELQSIKKEQADFLKAKSDFEAERVKLQQQLTEQNKLIGQMNDQELKCLVTMAQCQEDFNRIDWAEFEKLDPGKTALEQQKLLNRYQLAQQQYGQLQYQKQQLTAQQQYEYAQQQAAELVKLVPDWTDPVKFNTEVTGIMNWAKETYGLGVEVLGQVVDARERDIIRKAYLYDQLQKSKSGILKSSLKQIAGGKPIKPSDVKTKQVNSLIQKARQTRNSRDQIAAARAILDNS